MVEGLREARQKQQGALGKQPGIARSRERSQNPTQPTGYLLSWSCKTKENMVLSLKSCCLAFCACPLLAARGVWNSTARKAEQGRDFFPSAIRLGGLVLARPEPPMSMGQHMVTAKWAEEQ